jgi:hypothetical protein
VFRKPNNALLFSVLVGSGLQLTFIAATVMWATLFFSWNVAKGMTLVIFPFAGWINGYKSAEIYSYFKGTSWKCLAFSSAVFYPVIFSTLYNLVLIFEPE